jgi:5-methylcytosine-specific restriction endonuclease McrBC regulatory subunit McrC
LKEKVNFVNVGVDDCNKVQLSRLNDYYASILQFSKIIFQNCFIRSTQSGESKGFNFIVNMNKVYEDFITAMLEELIEEDKDFDDYTIEKQKKFNSLVVETDLITKPDVILKRNGSVNDYPLIIDAKYKKGDTQADYYQVIAYSLAIPTAISGCLIYPDTKKADKKYTLVKDPTNADSPKVMLHSVSIDLDKDLDFNDYVKAIKKDLKGIVLQCL